MYKTLKAYKHCHAKFCLMKNAQQTHDVLWVIITKICGAIKKHSSKTLSNDASLKMCCFCPANNTSFTKEVHYNVTTVWHASASGNSLFDSFLSQKRLVSIAGDGHCLSIACLPTLPP